MGSHAGARAAATLGVLPIFASDHAPSGSAPMFQHRLNANLERVPQDAMRNLVVFLLGRESHEEAMLLTYQLVGANIGAAMVSTVLLSPDIAQHLLEWIDLADGQTAALVCSLWACTWRARCHSLGLPLRYAASILQGNEERIQRRPHVTALLALPNFCCLAEGCCRGKGDSRLKFFPMDSPATPKFSSPVETIERTGHSD